MRLVEYHHVTFQGDAQGVPVDRTQGEWGGMTDGMIHTRGR
jgi:hypothetical protein